MTDRKHRLRQEFWTELTQEIEANSAVLPESFDRRDAEGPERDNWRSWEILPANARLGISVHLHDYIYVYLHLAHLETEDVFRHLRQYQDEIDAPFESQLQWRPTGSHARVPGKDKIICLREADILERPEQWDEYQHWLRRTAEQFYGVFSPHLRAYERQAPAPQ